MSAAQPNPPTPAPAAASAPASGAGPRSALAAALGRLKRLKGAIVAIAGVGAVLSGLVGWYTTYKTVAGPSTAALPPAQAVKAVNSKSIAVLPFVNMSGDPAQEYFSDGVSEELLNQLTQVHDLLVIARTSSFSFKGKEVKVEQIARELNVAHILQGSMRKSGNKVRVTAQLIRAADSAQLWSQTYDRDMGDIFAVQDEISAAVVEQLKAKLLGAAPKAKVVDQRAYTLLLQARAAHRRASADGYTQEIALLNQALQIDPAYGAAWVQLCRVYLNQANFGQRPRSQGFALARDALGKALAANPQDAAAHGLLAIIAMDFEDNLGEAAKQLATAAALAPDDESVQLDSADFLMHLGRIDEARAILTSAAARDPTNPYLIFNVAFSAIMAARYDEAMPLLRKVIALDAKNLNAHALLSLSLLYSGNPKAALTEAELETDPTSRLANLAQIWHKLGDAAKSDAALAELIRVHGKEAGSYVAFVQAYRGNIDQAFAWLDKAVANHDFSWEGVMMWHAEFANVRKDPRWLPLMRRVGRAPEQLAAIKFDFHMPTR